MKLSIQKYNNKYPININPERPYLVITDVEFPDSEIELSNVNLEIILANKNGSQRTEPITEFSLYSPENKTGQKIELNGYHNFHFRISDPNKKDFELIKCIIYYDNFELFNMDSPFKDFSKFIDSQFNTKILFSAPFGHGKTTFLTDFFEKKKREYNLFRVYPVNYSVSNNKDIFKYIKTELLLQALNSGLVDFSEPKETTLQVFSNILIQSPKKTILKFIKLALVSNPKTSFLNNGINMLECFLNKVPESDDIKLSHYLKDIANEEGSLYEDNLFTQLIRLSLEQIKNASQKESVLVIEDLDRIDPDHIFRILNVISAHFDEHLHENFIENNKFGFDKIILVCDKNNIREIFKHKYGTNCDFDGYINKFYSTTAFDFDNTKITNLIINRIISTNSRIDRESWLKPINDIYGLLTKDKQLSVRHLFKVFNLNFTEIIDEIKNSNNLSELEKVGVYLPVVSSLLKILEDELIEKVKLAKSKGRIVNQNDLEFICSNLLIPLLKKNNSTGSNYCYELNQRMLYCNIELGEGIYQYTIKHESTAPAKFTNDDFYELLIKNIELTTSKAS